MRTREEQREYQRKWVAARRKKWLSENGPCSCCGTWEKLEVDHIDPATKVHHAVWSWSEGRRVEELAKCRVLCRTCHQERHRPELVHSRAGYKRGCRCDLCRRAQRDYMRQLRAAS